MENNFWETQWNDFEEKDLINAIDELYQDINGKQFKPRTTSKDSWKLRKNTFITETKQNAISEKKGKYYEVLLERLFTVFGSKGLFNQFNLTSGLVDGEKKRTENIDLIITREGKITEIIELKAWDNRNDTPLLAVKELLKNYFIIKRLNDEQIERKDGQVCPPIIKKTKLTVLAPIEYYNNHLHRGDNEKLMIISKNVNSCKYIGKCDFSFEVLSANLNKKDLDKLSEYIRKIYNSFNKRKKYIL